MCIGQKGTKRIAIILILPIKTQVTQALPSTVKRAQKQDQYSHREVETTILGSDWISSGIISSA